MNILEDGNLEQRRALVDALGVPCCLIEVEPTGTFRLDVQNQHFLDLFGLEQRFEAVELNLDLTQKFAEDESAAEFYLLRLETMMSRCIRSGSAVRVELPTRLRGGRLFWTRDSYVPLTSYGVIHKVLVTMVEVTDLMESIRTVERELSELIGEHADICSYCHRFVLLDDKWVTVNDYILARPDLDFSHGICPECLKKQLP